MSLLGNALTNTPPFASQAVLSCVQGDIGGMLDSRAEVQYNDCPGIVLEVACQLNVKQWVGMWYEPVGKHTSTGPPSRPPSQYPTISRMTKSIRWFIRDTQKYNTTFSIMIRTALILPYPVHGIQLLKGIVTLPNSKRWDIGQVKPRYQVAIQSLRWTYNVYSYNSALWHVKLSTSRPQQPIELSS